MPVPKAENESFIQFIRGLYKEAMIPQRGTGWTFVALWGGHNFLGACLAAVSGYVLLQLNLISMSTSSIYIVDFIALMLYLPKEFADSKIGEKDLRDSFVDCFAVGFGAYLFSCAALFMIESCFYIVLSNLIACTWILFRFDQESSSEVR